MLTTSDLLENSLLLLGIPFILYDCVKENNLDERWQKDKDQVCGIIISGSRTIPEFNFEPLFPNNIIESLPVLGICYGHEILGNLLGVKTIDCNPPYGENSAVKANILPDNLFKGFDTSEDIIVTMRHDQMLAELPSGSKLIASTEMTPIAGFHHIEKKWWGIQFHPEKDWLASTVFKNFYRECRK